MKHWYYFFLRSSNIGGVFLGKVHTTLEEIKKDCFKLSYSVDHTRHGIIFHGKLPKSQWGG